MINDDARNDSLEGLLQELADSILKRSQSMLPCVVTAVSSNRTRVTVRPLIRIVGQDGATLPRDTIEGITVYQAGAGDLVMSFPVTAGDIGWIEASDRDISLFLQSYDESDPPTRRKHSFSDSRFIPDIMTNFTIAGEDSGAVVIQNRGGTVKIALDQSEIRVTNGAVSCVIDSQNVTAVAPGTINMTAHGGVFINGALINAAGDVIDSTGHGLRQHNHTQGNDSDGNSEQPTSSAVATETPP